MNIEISEIELPDEWYLLSSKQSEEMNLELNREVCKEHALHGLNVNAIARKYDRDDFLFEVIGALCPLYVVHLTWSVESKPEWPWITGFQSKDDFIVNWKKIYE